MKEDRSRAFTIRWIFLDKWNCTFFPLRKRNRLNRIIWSEFSNASEPGSGHMSCQQETWRLNFLSCETFYQTTWKLFFSFWRRRQFLLSSCCSVHISSGKPAISIHIFSHDVAQAEARWNVKEKHKYQPQNVIRFHLQGCSCVLKRPPTLPTSKESHCNDKRFGNLPPSFRSIAFLFFLGSITVKSLAL